MKLRQRSQQVFEAIKKGGKRSIRKIAEATGIARANASKINKTKWTKSLAHASNARISFSVNLIFSSVDGR